MASKFSKEMEEKFKRELEQMNDDDDSADEKSLGESFYQAERKRVQEALNNLKKKQHNTILTEIQKVAAEESDYINEFTEHVEHLQKITSNDQKNVIDESILEDIKKKVFNQSMLNQISLADKQVEEKMKKEEQQQKKEKKLHQSHQKAGEKMKTDSQVFLSKKIQDARTEQENISMGRQDDYSLKHENYVLSQFFQDRFIQPQFPNPQQNCPPIKIEVAKPKKTFSNLAPLPNTEANVLPKNSPEIALRKIKKTKKITLTVSSMVEVKVKVKQSIPKKQQKNDENEIEKEKQEKKTKIDNVLEEFVHFVKPKIKQIKKISSVYKPQFINQFLSQNQQTNNIDLNTDESRSLGSALAVQEHKKIKQLKLTFQRIKDTKGIEQFKNLQHVSLQYNLISSIDLIESCSKLIQINLSHNQLKNIKNLQNLKWLRYVNIEHNKIRQICFEGGSLQILLAGHNQIEEIVNLSANSNLKKLILNNNKLHELKGLQKLYFVEEINIKNNFIKVLQGIEDCILLRVLDASSNRIEKLNEKFYFLFLNQLTLTGNMLTVLPNMFLPSLQEFLLDKNKLSQQSESLIYLPSLKLLNMDENNLIGFGVVWSILRFSRNLQILKYDQNECFLHIREKVRELYEYIIYKNMNKLEFLNQNSYDLGVKKYYESAYESYLSKCTLFESEKAELSEIKNKIMFIIHENKSQFQLEKEKRKFRESNIFIQHKSVKKSDDLLEIIDFLTEREGKVLKGKKSLFYEHDKFQNKLRKNIHKIENLFLKIRYYQVKKKAFYDKNKDKIRQILRNVEIMHFENEKRKAILHFYKPLVGMNKEKAAIVIQKNWRCYQIRKRFLKAMRRLKQPMEEESLPEVSFDFDETDFIEPDFNMEEFNFEEYIIKPEVFSILETKKVQRQEHYEKKNPPKKLVNNFIEENNSVAISERRQEETKVKKEEEDRLMKEWGFKDKKSLLGLQAKKKRKEEWKKKEAQKNMTAAERYERFKNSHK